MTGKQTSLSELNLSSEAMSYLGLSQQPFSSAVLTDEAIFSDASLEQIIETTKHHLQFSDLLLLIEGEYGSGKTTLFRQLFKHDIDNLFLISVSASATDTLTQIQQSISNQLKDQGDANHLDANLKHLQSFDQTPVLVIDDAHVLSDNSLQEILLYQKQLLNEQQLTLKLLMLAHPGISKTIEDISNLEHSQLYVQALPCLTPKQIHSFLSQRLNSAQYKGEDIFGHEMIQAIFKKSLGMPLQLMQEAAAQIEKLVIKSKPSATTKKRPLFLFAGMTLIVFIGISIYYFFQQQTPMPVVNEIKTTENTTDVTSKIKVIQPEIVINTAVVAAEKTTPSSNEELTKITPSTHDIDKLNAPDSVAFNEPSNTKIDTQDSKPLTTVNVNKTKLTEDTLAADAISADTKTPDTIEIGAGKQTLTIKHPPEPNQPPAPDTAPTADIAKTAAIASKAETLKPANQIRKPALTKNQLFELKAMGLKDAHWLMQQNPQHWTLQIMGARQPDTLLKFVKQHKLGENSAWFSTMLSGRPWYVLVHRLYTDKNITRAAIQTLPANLKNTKPWIKSLSTVQQSIKRGMP